MKENDAIISMESLRVKPGKEIRLKDFNTGYTGDLTKERGIELLDASRETLAAIQDKLYAHNHYSVLIIFQGMDAAGKDGAVKHIMSGFNPLGVKVTSFKTPTNHELEHDFFWRHYLALPARGEIAIHNRSHYENVLVTRVHPEYVLHENIPGIGSVADITEGFWESRFKQINRFEKNLAKNGTVILKFFLNLSKKEQKRRFLERIDDPTKNWKFSSGDIQERAHWKEYQAAYEQAINATSPDYAPWFIIPADDKWYARLAIASAIVEKFEELKISYPAISEEQKAALQKARTELTGEE